MGKERWMGLKKRWEKRDGKKRGSEKRDGGIRG